MLETDRDYKRKETISVSHSNIIPSNQNVNFDSNYEGIQIKKLGPGINLNHRVGSGHLQGSASH